MGLEAGTYLNDLNTANPAGGDPRAEGDNHIRLLKTTLKNTFPGLAGRAWRTQGKSANYTLSATDNMTYISCSAALTITGDAAALGNGFRVKLRNTSTNAQVSLPGGNILRAGEVTSLFSNGSTFEYDSRIEPFVVMEADLTGVSSATAAIQDRIDAAVAAGSGVVYLRNGTYLLDDTLTWDANGIAIVGESMWTAKLLRTTDYGDTIFINNTSVTDTRRINTTLRGFRLDAAGAMTSGAHIHINRGQFWQIDSIAMTNGFVSINAESLAQAVVDNIWVVNSSLYGGSLTGRSYLKLMPMVSGSAVARNGDLVVSNFNFRQSSGHMAQFGIWIEASDGIWFTNGHVGGCSGAQMLLNHSNTTTDDILVNVDCTNVIFDAGSVTDTSYGVVFQGSVFEKGFRNILFSNCTLLGGQTDLSGVYVASGCDARDVLFTGGTVFGYRQHGIALNSVDTGAFTFDNMRVFLSGSAEAGTYNNINIAGANHVSVTGGIIGGTQYATTQPPTARYGISINPSSKHITINGVSFKEPYSYGINVGQVTDTVSIEGCNDEALAYYYLYFDTQSSAFVVGDTVRGKTSGHTGTLVRQWDAGTAGVLILRDCTGVFQDNETLESARYGEVTYTDRALANGTAWTAYSVPTMGTLLLLPQQRYQNVRAGADLAFNTQTVNFTAMEFIRGGTSGAMALLWTQTDSGATGTLRLAHVVGTFQAGETLTGSEGGAALATGAQTAVTSVTNINPAQRDRLAILRFAQSTTMTDGGNLKLSATTTFDADDSITLVCDGAVWYEISRSVN